MYFGFVIGLRLLVEMIFEVIDIELFLYKCMVDIDWVVFEYRFELIDERTFSKTEQSAHGFDSIESN